MAEADLIVIGGGPGGYVAAIRAAQLGMKVILIEREHLGGICLNWGCIPTKALLRSGEIRDLMTDLAGFGLRAENVRIDLPAIVKRSRQIAGQLNRGVAHLLRKQGVTVIEGSARLTGGGRVEVQAADPPRLISAPHIVLATGARARQLAGLEADGDRVWTYKEAMVPDAMPASLLVVGSGAIGVEFASFYRSLGAEVTLVEVIDRILPVEDPEVSAFAHKAFEKRGIKIFTGSTVSGLERKAAGVTATIDRGGQATQVKVDRVIMAVGITGNVEDVGLEQTKAKVDRGHVIVDQWCRTGEPGLYAIGDVVGPPWLAHKASHEAVLCVERIAETPGVQPIDVTKIPGCTYANPQVASIGLTEQAAIDAGYEVRVGRFPFLGNGKALALGEPEGLVKTVFDRRTGELLGAHMVGAEVTELIQGYALARQMEATEEDLMHTVFPHPTLSETMHESVLAAYGRAIHI